MDKYTFEFVLLVDQTFSRSAYMITFIPVSQSVLIWQRRYLNWRIVPLLGFIYRQLSTFTYVIAELLTRIKLLLMMCLIDLS